MGKISHFFIYIIISVYKRISSSFIKNQAVYYKRKLGNRFSFVTIPSLGKIFYCDLQQNSEIHFGAQFNARGSFSLIGRREGKIRIGENVFFNLGCSISCFNSISIGDNVMFGENVKLYDHNHEYRNKAALIAHQGYNIASIKIGNNCWIGTNVVILKGVTIGDNVIIGAGIVVNKDVISNQIIFNKQDIINVPF